MILGDWGTSRLRLFRADGAGGWAKREGPGIGALDAPAAEVLDRTLGDWRGAAPVRLAGMAGARGGLHEVGYVDCPADERAWRAGAARFRLGDLHVAIAAGLAMPPGAVADVMRGEETQIFGALALDPALGRGAQLVIHPGTHSKWAWIEDGVVTRFRTFFTGELYALLLKSTLTRLEGAAEGEAAGFADGLGAAGEPLLGALFTARAAQLREGKSAGWAKGYLSGLLIGHELAALPEAAAPITLIGAPGLTDAYADALAARGRDCQRLDGDACVIAGLERLED